MTGARTGHSSGLGPVLLLLLLAVTVPTLCVLWFMGAAMENERLAMRQKLEDAYQDELDGAAGFLEDYGPMLSGLLGELISSDADEDAGMTFRTLVGTGPFDSLVICDDAGRVRYPTTGARSPATQVAETAEWLQARSLEYDESDPVAAAAAYGKIAREATDINTAARALQAQARCLVRAGQRKAALNLLTQALAGGKYDAAVDAHGRLIVPDALLRALELMGDPKEQAFKTVSRRLRERLEDYADLAMPSNQRRFLMRQLEATVPDCPPFPTLAAEDLAAQYLESSPKPATPGLLSRTPLPGVWQVASPDRKVVALLQEASVVSHVESLRTAVVGSPPRAKIRILPPGTTATAETSFMSRQVGGSMAGWQVALYLTGPNPFAREAERQIAVYYWTGMLVVVAIALLAALVARYLVRQMRLTRLKNDLIATVSHELKTPLASMRVLADTLLAGKTRDERQAHEYVELIAKENARLSRLIDNFLTFSRMERNKRSFEFADVRVHEIVTAAVEAVGDRFASPDCRLDVDVSPDLPTLRGDRDALVTVLINLLDNAYKYSEDHEEIALRAHAAGGNICLEVEDNGVGLSRRAARKIFDRFYQVDQSLARRAGGCGLGLGIVKFIVETHGGSIEVSSELGMGSTFTITLPVVGASTAVES